MLLSYEKGQNYAICSNLDETRDYHLSEASKKRERYYMVSLKYGI